MISTDTYVRKYHTETKKRKKKNEKKQKKKKNNNEYHPEQGTIE